MGKNAKGALMDTLVALCKTKALHKITVTDLLREAGVTRNAFYAMFRDINDLICCIYWERIAAPHWMSLTTSYDDYYMANLLSLKKVRNHYGPFLLQALEMRGQNCLQEYILKRTVDFEFRCAKKYFTPETYDELAFALRFNAYGWINTRMEWIQGGMGEPVELLARRITNARMALISGFMPDQRNVEAFRNSTDLVEINPNHHLEESH